MSTTNNPTILHVDDKTGAYVDSRGLAWAKCTIDYFAEMQDGQCAECGATLTDGDDVWTCLDDASYELCTSCCYVGDNAYTVTCVAQLDKIGNLEIWRGTTAQRPDSDAMVAYFQTSQDIDALLSDSDATDQDRADLYAGWPIVLNLLDDYNDLIPAQ